MIFIVDDDAGVRDSLRLLLESEGFAAQEFASARQFLENGRSDDNSCLIVDVQMPGMNGLELLEHLRRHGDKLPAIVISGHLNLATRKRANAAGAFAVVEKPHKSGKLLDLIRLALESGNQGPIRTCGESNQDKLVTDYRVDFINKFARNDRVYKVCQRSIVVLGADTREGAIETAKKRFTDLEGIRDWRTHAAMIEVGPIAPD